MKTLILIAAIFLCASLVCATEPVATCKGSTTGGTSINCSTTITPGASGHRFIATVTGFGNLASIAFSMSNTAGSTWSKLVQQNTTGGTGYSIQLFCAQVNSVAAQTFTGSTNQASNVLTVNVIEYATLTSCTVDNSQTNGNWGMSTGVTSVTGGNVTTTQGDRVISAIMTVSLTDTSVNSVGSGYTKQLSNQINATGVGGGIQSNEIEDQWGTGTFASAWTNNVTTGSSFTCPSDGLTGQLCWVIEIVLIPANNPNPVQAFPYIAKFDVPSKKIPWDNRKRKLEIARI